jgi:hypothetical protein
MHGQWQAYQVVLRLHTPLHVGWGRVSYLQRARPYVTGRVLRGALVSRLVRRQSQPEGALNDSATYRKIGKTTYQHLAFTYFFPTLKKKDKPGWEVCFPWENESSFRRRFLSSYAATSLNYPQQSAAEGLLYETEFISPYTLDDGRPVYLMGYVFQMDCCKLQWKETLQAGLQLGGERGYGWGRVSLQDIAGPRDPDSNGDIELFGNPIGFEGSKPHPILRIHQGDPLLAHATTQGTPVSGIVEPLVGREWRSEEGGNRKHIGQYINFDNLCFAPGGIVQKDTAFTIGKGGCWQQTTASFDPERPKI